jgi:hypothetical protein
MKDGSENELASLAWFVIAVCSLLVILNLIFISASSSRYLRLNEEVVPSVSCHLLWYVAW